MIYYTLTDYAIGQFNLQSYHRDYYLVLCQNFKKLERSGSSSYLCLKQKYKSP